MAMHEKYKFDSLSQMYQGSIPPLFEEAAQGVLKDCKDRFEDDKPREITIKLLYVPKKNTHGDEVDTEVEVSWKVPRKRTRVNTLAVRNNGEATFHPDLPENPNGSTLYDDVDRNTGEVRE
jgi:hypothetical protein